MKLQSRLEERELNWGDRSKDNSIRNRRCRSIHKPRSMVLLIASHCNAEALHMQMQIRSAHNDIVLGLYVRITSGSTKDGALHKDGKWQSKIKRVFIIVEGSRGPGEIAPG